jgi:pantoate--beta-alanine ligase
MRVVRTVAELRAWRRGVGRLAIVPTMGALHAGHLALIAAARAHGDAVAASIFVNPTQFGPNEDLSRYPRQEAADAAALEAAGCDLLFAPSAAEMYPDGFATVVKAGPVAARWDGTARPGHFDGVATVVAKLFGQFRPDAALFGEKDWQQLCVIRRMAADLDIAVDIVGCPTVRDMDGLALSSRNAYLSADERARAVALPQALDAAKRRIEAGDAVAAALADATALLAIAGFGPIDYVALVGADDLEPLARADRSGRLIAAAKLGMTRLIDNMAVSVAPLTIR